MIYCIGLIRGQYVHLPSLLHNLGLFSWWCWGYEILLVVRMSLRFGSLLNLTMGVSGKNVSAVTAIADNVPV